jgi:hypothetical protein
MAGKRVANTSSKQVPQCKDLMADKLNISLISISANLKPLRGSAYSEKIFRFRKIDIVHARTIAYKEGHPEGRLAIHM